jgi:hypothetical protein
LLSGYLPRQILGETFGSQLVGERLIVPYRWLHERHAWIYFIVLPKPRSKLRLPAHALIHSDNTQNRSRRDHAAQEEIRSLSEHKSASTSPGRPAGNAGNPPNLQRIGGAIVAATGIGLTAILARISFLACRVSGLPARYDPKAAVTGIALGCP